MARRAGLASSVQACREAAVCEHYRIQHIDQNPIGIQANVAWLRRGDPGCPAGTVLWGMTPAPRARFSVGRPVGRSAFLPLAGRRFPAPCTAQSTRHSPAGTARFNAYITPCTTHACWHHCCCGSASLSFRMSSQPRTQAAPCVALVPTMLCLSMLSRTLSDSSCARGKGRGTPSIDCERGMLQGANPRRVTRPRRGLASPVQDPGPLRLSPSQTQHQPGKPCCPSSTLERAAGP